MSIPGAKFIACGTDFNIVEGVVDVIVVVSQMTGFISRSRFSNFSFLASFISIALTFADSMMFKVEVDEVGYFVTLTWCPS